MKVKAVLLGFAAALAGAGAGGAHAQAQDKPQVMILGTFHLDNPGQDYSNPQVDDVLTERRQRDLEALAEMLARYRPTRIAVEWPTSAEGRLNERYRQYLAGTYTATRDETDQIAYRLAKRLGHERLYAIDWKKDLDVGAVLQFGAQNGQGELVQAAQAHLGRIMADFAERQPRSTVAELLLRHNDAEWDRMQGLYTTLGTIGRDSTYIGADMAADWYERNLKIFANVARVAAAPEERVLVIIGAGHGPLLRQFVREAGLHELVPLERYVTAPAAPR